MDRTARFLVLFVACLLGGAALAALWLVGGETDEAEPVAAPRAVETPKEKPADRHRLEIVHSGYPLVTVRRGEKVAVHSSPGGKVIREVGWRTEFESRRQFSVVRTREGWAAVPTSFLDNDELGWVKLDSRRLRATWTSYSIWIDLSDKRAWLQRREEAVRSFPVTVGAPGSETPTGRFAVSDTFIGGLNPAYGCCALALTARQPKVLSGWLGGNRIAIHGTTGPLGLALSHGCVRADQTDVRALVERVPPGTPVTIRR